MKKNLVLKKIALAVILYITAIPAFAGGRIYFSWTDDTNPAPYVWAWSGEGTNVNNVYDTWPGKQMDVFNMEYYGKHVYYVEFENSCPEYVIFSNKGSDATTTINTEGYNKLYDQYGSIWVDCVSPATPTWYIYGQLKDDADWTDHTMTSSGDNVSYTCTLDAGKEYYLKVKYQDSAITRWYSSSSMISRSTCYDVDFSADRNNAMLVTSKGGTYTFTLDPTTMKLSVTYPDALAVSAINSTCVPSENPDVMIQAYYWAHVDNDSTRWIPFGGVQWTDLTSQADTLGKYFKLVWLAPSAVTKDYTGFLPSNYSDQNNVWGNETELKALINRLHSNGAKVVADIVINHSSPSTGFCTWDSAFNFGDYGTFYPNKTWIARDDEIYIAPDWEDKYHFRHDTGVSGGEPAGIQNIAGDCGSTDDWGPEYDEKTYSTDDNGNNANWSYAEYNCVYSRDWAHNMKEVREMSRAYLTWMKEYIGYDGWRYDFAKGLHASHLDDYNRASNAAFSVAEVFDFVIDKETGVIRDSKYNTYVFDFPGKNNIMNDGIRYGVYEKIKGSNGKTMLCHNKKHTVTFVDNHDSFREHHNLCNTPNEIGDTAKVIMANAFILSMPGVPCVFYPHWSRFQEVVKPLIMARRITGVHSESEVFDEALDTWDGNFADQTHYYKATIIGKSGNIRLLLGPSSGYKNCPSGYKPAYVGKDDVYVGVYYSRNEDPETNTVYFLDSTNMGAVNAYLWRASDEMRNNDFPGEAMKYEGMFNGYKLFSYTYPADLKYTNIIFSNATNNNNKTQDLTLTDHAGKCYLTRGEWGNEGWIELTSLKHTLSIGESRWASMYLPLKVALPAGVHGYYAADKSGENITLNVLDEDIVPAFTGVLVTGPIGTHELQVTTENTTPFTNMFGGTKSETATSSITSSGTVYVLSSSQTQVAQVPVFGAYTGYIPAGKAYLLVESGSGAPEIIRFSINEPSITTDVESIVEDNEPQKIIRNGQLFIIRDGAIYNALGKRIQ